MNILAVSSDLIACAQALDDKRINKMIVEFARSSAPLCIFAGAG